MLNEFLKKEAPIQGLAGMGGGVPSRLLTLAAGEITYVDDVFSTILRDGTGASKTITNGIDLDGKGGLIWTKRRNTNDQHSLADSGRGKTGTYYLEFASSSTYGSQDRAWGISSFNSNGYTLGGTDNQMNGTGNTYCDWVFRKCRGFFDVVTWTGDGTSGRQISHSLGSVPGAIFIKQSNATRDWCVYHRGTDASNPSHYKTHLNKTDARADEANIFNDTEPTSTVFTLGSDSEVNSNGDTYVAYLFAHNDGSFGEDSDEAVIKCDYYTGTGSTGLFVDLGFEPQWLIIKRVDSTEDWHIFDNMRGVVNGSDDYPLKANNNYNESTAGVGEYIKFTPKGFEVDSTGSPVGSNGGTYIYIAIRRGGHKQPEAATEVFHLGTKSAKSANTPSFQGNFVVDFALRRNNITSTDPPYVYTRLTSHERLATSNTDDALSVSGGTGHFQFTDGYGNFGSGDSNDYGYFWKRAAGFFDVVTYHGHEYKRASENYSDVPHNLGVVPEMIWIKARNLNNATNSRWIVYHKDIGNSDFLFLHEDSTTTGTNYFGNEDPTSSQFTLFAGGFTTVDYGTSNNYLALLFASLDGISKVGSYTGNGADNRTIDCGFTSGARFVIIKRTDQQAKWFVFDSQRGIVSGNDPYFALDNSDAQVTSADYVEPANAGFAVNSHSDFNANGGNYIFYAVA
jgi:hypothetical protein